MTVVGVAGSGFVSAKETGCRLNGFPLAERKNVVRCRARICSSFLVRPFAQRVEKGESKEGK